MIRNPFPGPQPYRASDRSLFYGRTDLSYKLATNILANRCVTVYGPSGAGKSSLVQASVLPGLIESHDIQVVRLDSWPDGQEPVRWFAQTMYHDLGLHEVPDEVAPGEAIRLAAQRAARRSSRLVVVYLDQIEQLLYSGRSVAETEPFFESIHQLADLPLRNLHLVLSLREDYLGRFRDRLRDRRRLLDHGFRVGPLTVIELCDSVCMAAAAGEPPQEWAPEPMRLLMLQVRVPGQAESDEAEAQAAYAQIVCRALFQERAQGDKGSAESADIEAEPILRRYLETTLEDLGPMRAVAQRLLEDHLITEDGGRTVRTEKELAKLLPGDSLPQVLRALENAAILHAEEHQGTRHFELGHDWLAKKVYDERQAREHEEEQKRRTEEQRKELERQQAETEARMAKERRRRRQMASIAAVSLVVTAITGALGVLAWRAKQAAEHARREAERLGQIAEEKQIEAHDARIVAGYRELSARGQRALAMKLLPEVQRPTEQRGWVDLATDALNANALEVTLSGHDGPLTTASFSPDGKRILTAALDATARVWNADGSGRPVILKGHKDLLRSAAWSPDGKRVVTASDDTTARVWNADGSGEPVVLKGHGGLIHFAAWSPDSKRVVTASDDKTTRVWNADGSGEPVVRKGHDGPVRCAVFLPDNTRIVTASEDNTVRLWEGDGSSVTLRGGHNDQVVFLAVSPDGTRVVSTSRDGTARIWESSGKGAPVVLKGHGNAVLHAAWSPDNQRVATASADRTARVWAADGKREPRVLRGHELTVPFVSWSPSGEYIATASADRTARIFRSDGRGAPLVLGGHSVSVRTVRWNHDGSRVVTAAGDDSGRALEPTAKVWRTDILKSIRLEARGKGYFHSAFIGADREHVVSAFDDNTARLWHIKGAEPTVTFEGHTGWITSAALSPDGKRVVTASLDKTARVWSADGKEQAILKGHEADVRYAAFSPDGQRIVTASEDKTARVWSMDGKEQAALRGHEDWLSSAAWSPDGKRIATASWDYTVRVWSADGAGAPVVLSGHTGDVYTAVWSPDGKRIASVSYDRTARVWNADGSGDPVVLHEHTGAVVHAVWSPDGTKLATSSSDKTVRLWSLESKTEPIVLDSSAAILDMEFVEDSKRIIAVGSDNTTDSWMIDVNLLKDLLRVAHADCVPTGVRVVYLGESSREAREKYMTCEKSNKRDPLLLAKSSP